IASPADVTRAGLPPPINVELPSSASSGGDGAAAPDAPPVAPTLDDALAREPDNVALLVARATRLGAAAHYSAAQHDYERALHRLGIVLDRLNRPAEATRMYRRSREAAAR